MTDEIEHLRRRLADKDRIFRWLVDQLDDTTLDKLQHYMDEHPVTGDDQNL